MKKNRLVYVIASASGRVKIGIAYDPEERLKQLQTGSFQRLRILGLLQGGSQLESYLHEKFKYQRLVGEWFEPNMRMIRWMLREGILPTPMVLVRAVIVSILFSLFPMKE